MGRAATAGDEEEAAAKRRVFSGEARSFRMDRRSPAATGLRAAVAEKLVHFLGNYSDDVLPEYIVVLVCNGKHQYQARDDLEAFLGDDSAKFVAWLWDHLSKRTLGLPHNSSVQSGVADDCQNLNGQKNVRVVNAQSGDAPTSKADLNDPPKSSFKPRYPNSGEVYENFQTYSITDGQVNSKISAPQAPHGLQKLDSTKGQSVARRRITSTLRFSPDRLAGGEQCFWYEGQHQKKDQNNSSATARRSLSIRKSDLAARTAQSVTQEDLMHREQLTRNAATGRLPLKAVDVEALQSMPKHGNVWDRLGKPVIEDGGLIRGNDDMPGHNGVRKKPKSILIEHEPKSWGNLNRRLELFDKSSTRTICNSYSDDNRAQLREVNKHTPNHMENSNRKRLFGQINSGSSCASLPGLRENHLQDRVISQKSDLTLLVKNDQSHSLNELRSEVKSSPMAVPESACPLRKFSNVGHESASSKLPQLNVLRSPMTAALHNQQVGSPARSKTGPVIREGGGNCSNKPVKDEMLDVKLKLQQVERDMLKLRSKQMQMSNAKQSALPGSQSHSEEDADSRTVLVTNIHFGATKEALSSHFMKCGTVLKVNMLTDATTGRPKGAAYIIFAGKESAEKAISLNGTSFFSRVLTVMHKADTPPGYLVSAQQNWKPVQPWTSQPSQKAIYQKQCTSSHLQWKRDQSVGRENSVPVAMDKLETS